MTIPASNTLDMIKAELQPGETIRWAGKPKFVPVLMKHIWQSAIGFSLIGIAARQVFQIAEPLGSGKAPGFGGSNNEIVTQVLACFFFLLGFRIITGSILLTIEMSQAAYAVTNRRILIVSHLFRKRVQAFTPGSINAVETLQKHDRSGTVTFRRDVVHGGEGDMIVKSAFVGIDDVLDVAREIEKLRLSVQPSASSN